ncbi:MAG: arsenate reductase ArsC [Planctomycetota bacterium]|nr:arsenate reductase ArsC [Planctomycetota bacterium]
MIDEEVNDEPEQTEENVEEQVSEQPDGETVEGSPEAGEEAEAEAPAEVADDTETAGDEAGEEPVVEETAGEEAGGETAPAEAAGPARVLFLCTGNSCRSQMAEGLLRNLAPDAYESLSAGSRPAEAVHPMAIAVMQELEIDISAQQPKSIEIFLTGEQPAPNIVISVCAKASEECPAFTGAEVLSMSLPFDDPADAEGDDEEKLTVFRRVRDEIRETLQQALGL